MPPDSRTAALTGAPSLALLDGLSVAAVVVDGGGSLVHANAAALDLLGGPYDALVGADARTRLLDPADRAVVDDVLGAVHDRGSWTGELELVVADGEVRTLPTTWSATGEDGAVVLVEAERAVAGALGPSSRRLRRLASVTTDLLAAQSVAEVATIVTDQVKLAAGATVASLSLLTEPGTLALAGLSGASAQTAATYATYSLDSANPAAESARTHRVLQVSHEELARRYPDMPPVSHGVRSMLCLPLVARGEAIGVIALSLPGRHRIDDSELLYLRLLADTCAMTLDRLEAQRAADDREAKLSFLADVSTRLLGGLDHDATLAAVAEAAVPWLADWCTVALDEDGTLRVVALAHAQPDLDTMVRELTERYPARPGDASYAVLTSGRSLLTPEIPDEWLQGASHDAEHLALLRSLDLRSAMTVPLWVRDRVVGVVTWVAGPGRRYDESDLVFAEDLAHRAAQAIDNAQLHTQVRASALELTRAVLPERLYDVPGIRTAVEYLPAGRTDAGGDFYDVVYLDDGRIATFVGDVMGRGVSAASTMAQMRAAIRTLIAVDPDPVALMRAMDRVFEALHLEQLVTMVYVVADPARDRVEVINAGHPAPVLLTAGGDFELLEHPSTLILGVGGGERAVRTARYAPGDALLLYTDGLVERRGEDADAATARLVEALGTPCGEGRQQWLTRVVETMRDPTRDDDVLALLVARDPG